METGNRKFSKRKKHLIETMKYIVIDDGNIQKKYAEKMEGLEKVRDGSTGKTGKGFRLLDILAVSGDWGKIPIFHCRANL